VLAGKNKAAVARYELAEIKNGRLAMLGRALDPEP
jgi:hypothetical protein